MSMFRCPLCGKTNSYNRFNPEGFENDILGVTVSGLGRGRGFGFSENYSLLDDDYLTGLIRRRCRSILKFTEGEEPPPPGTLKEYSRINSEWVAWGAEAQKALTQKDSQINLLSNEVTTLNGRVNALNERFNHSGPI